MLRNTVFHCSYLMKPLGETLILLSVVLPLGRSLNYYTSILFVLHKCRNFFCVARFGGAILVFRARLSAASCCCNFAFFSTTYGRSLSHLSLLAFVTFCIFHTSLSPIFHTSLSPFFLHKLMRFQILSFISLT